MSKEERAGGGIVTLDTFNGVAKLSSHVREKCAKVEKVKT
jgi:hypothetical protein